MAIITKMPNLAIINGFKGVIDFYVYKGLIVARKWPKKITSTRSVGVREGWQAWTDASRLWSQLSPEVRESYKKMTGRGGLSGRDIFTKSYIGGIFRYPHTPTP